MSPLSDCIYKVLPATGYLSGWYHQPHCPNKGTDIEMMVPRSPSAKWLGFELRFLHSKDSILRKQPLMQMIPYAVTVHFRKPSIHDLLYLTREMSGQVQDRALGSALGLEGSVQQPLRGEWHTQTQQCTRKLWVFMPGD